MLKLDENSEFEIAELYASGFSLREIGLLEQCGLQ